MEEHVYLEESNRLVHHRDDSHSTLLAQPALKDLGSRIKLQSCVLCFLTDGTMTNGLGSEKKNWTITRKLWELEVISQRP